MISNYITRIQKSEFRGLKTFSLLRSNFLIRVLLSVPFLIVASIGFAQNKKLNLEGKNLIDQGYFVESLKKFEIVLKSDPHNIEALTSASWAYINIGGKSIDPGIKYWHYQMAKEFSLKAIYIDDRNVNAHLKYTVALGLLTEVVKKPRERLSNVKIIKKEAEKILSLDPGNDEAHYILGRWHYEISKLSWLETLAADILFGGTPGPASLDKSVGHYKTAISLNPDFVLFYYGLAKAYIEMGNLSKAKSILLSAVKLKAQDFNDNLRLVKCKNLLNEINKVYRASKY